MIVSNATPIINFGKAGVLDILKECFINILIPRAVYNEIMEKKENSECVALRKAIDEGWINIEDNEINPLLKTNNLGKGEKEAISLAINKKALLLIDDDSAKSYASVLGVEAHGSFYVLYLACVKKIIDKNKAKEIFEGVIREGFYISTDVYSTFLKLLEEIK